MTTLLRADLRAASVEPATAIFRPDALTDQDADRIAAAIGAARIESTRRVYTYTWGQWARGCAARGLSPLPGDPAALCAYLTERAAAGLAITSHDGACTAIRNVHRMHGVDDPVASETVRQVRLGLRRTYGTAPRRLARPLSTAGICQILHRIDRTTPVGIPRRRTDPARLRLRNVALRAGRPHPARCRGETGRVAGYRPPVQVRPGRTRPDRRRRPGQSPGDRPGDRPGGRARRVARSLRGHEPGPLFTRLYRSQISLQPLSGDAIARMLRTRAQAAGLDATRITAHSLRAGHATTALGGVPLARIAAQTRHKDLSVLVSRYIRPLEALATTSSRDLGL